LESKGKMNSHPYRSVTPFDGIPSSGF
jgi:hypothetical protein